MTPGTANSTLPPFTSENTTNIDVENKEKQNKETKIPSKPSPRVESTITEAITEGSTDFALTFAATQCLHGDHKENASDDDSFPPVGDVRCVGCVQSASKVP